MGTWPTLQVKEAYEGVVRGIVASALGTEVASAVGANSVVRVPSTLKRSPRILEKALLRSDAPGNASLAPRYICITAASTAGLSISLCITIWLERINWLNASVVSLCPATQAGLTYLCITLAGTGCADLALLV